MSKSAGKFSRGYKGGRRSSDVNFGPPSKAYIENAGRMGWDKSPKFCACGRLPAWCECAKEQKSIGNMSMAIANGKRFATFGEQVSHAFRSDRAEPGEQQEHNG